MFFRILTELHALPSFYTCIVDITRCIYIFIYIYINSWNGKYMYQRTEIRVNPNLNSGFYTSKSVFFFFLGGGAKAPIFQLMHIYSEMCLGYRHSKFFRYRTLLIGILSVYFFCAWKAF